jgi:hypothetical protein
LHGLILALNVAPSGWTAEAKIGIQHSALSSLAGLGFVWLADSQGLVSLFVLGNFD